ncbi:MAG: DNA-processing protein DprA [Vulcanimicrobiaceae bacterium]
MSPQRLPREHFAALRGNRDLADIISELWALGSTAALALPCVAVVGTRAASAYGRRHARQIAADLAASGCCILSGLALGIDTAAHEGALDAGGATIGILGGGHNVFLPRKNRRLAARRVAAGGAVLSPFAPDCPPRPGQFLQRNGIVAALADAVLVIEAPLRSGSLNTAGWAADRIPVLALPGDADRRQSEGSHALIRDGATLARNARDVLEALGIAASLDAHQAASPAAKTMSELARSTLHALRDGEVGFDALVAATRAQPYDLLATLCELELNGFVAAIPGHAWVRV